MLSIKHRRSTVALTAALVAGATALTGVSSTAAPAPTAKSHRSEARTSGHSEARGYYDSRTAGGSAAGTTTRPAVIGTRVLGHSVKGRAIRAWHLGEPGQQRLLLHDDQLQRD